MDDHCPDYFQISDPETGWSALAGNARDASKKLEEKIMSSNAERDELAFCLRRNAEPELPLNGLETSRRLTEESLQLEAAKYGKTLAPDADEAEQIAKIIAHELLLSSQRSKHEQQT